MDYYFNNKPIIDEYNIYHKTKLKKQIMQSNNNMELFRNNSILKEKMISKKYRTSKNSAQKLIEDSSQYINEKSSDLFANKIRKKYKKSNNFRDLSGNYHQNYNKYLINNSGLGNNNINKYNNISNSNFAYNYNLLNYYNNNSLETNDILKNNNNYNAIKNHNNINNIKNNNKIFIKKINHKNLNEEFDKYVEPENSYNNINNYISNNGIDLNINNNNVQIKKYMNGYKKKYRK